MDLMRISLLIDKYLVINIKKFIKDIIDHPYLHRRLVTLLLGCYHHHYRSFTYWPRSGHHFAELFHHCHHCFNYFGFGRY